MMDYDGCQANKVEAERKMKPSTHQAKDTELLPERSELKPCPFCGGAPELEQDELKQGTEYTDVACNSVYCMVQPKALGIPAKPAVESWNTRVQSPAQPPSERLCKLHWLQSERHDEIEEHCVICLVDRLKELKQSPAQAEWLPISEAPKDGRTLLLGYPNALGKWRTVRGQWFTDEEISEWENADDGFEAWWYETSVENDDPPNCWAIKPTHWMPLPEPPKGAS